MRIPSHSLARIQRELARRVHVFDVTDIKITRVQELLVELNMTPLLEFKLRISMMLTRQPLPSFTLDEIDVLVRMYELMRTLHIFLATPDKSFPNHKVITRENCERLGMHEFAACFARKKTVDKNRAQDHVSLKIANLIGRPFCPNF